MINQIIKNTYLMEAWLSAWSELSDLDLDLQTGPRYPCTWPTCRNSSLGGEIEIDRHTHNETMPKPICNCQPNVLDYKRLISDTHVIAKHIEGKANRAIMANLLLDLTKLTIDIGSPHWYVTCWRNLETGRPYTKFKASLHSLLNSNF